MKSTNHSTRTACRSRIWARRWKSLRTSCARLSREVGPSTRNCARRSNTPGRNCKTPSSAARPRCRTRSKRCVASRATSPSRPGTISSAPGMRWRKGRPKATPVSRTARNWRPRAGRSANWKSSCGDRRAGSKNSSGGNSGARHCGASETSAERPGPRQRLPQPRNPPRLNPRGSRPNQRPRLPVPPSRDGRYAPGRPGPGGVRRGPQGNNERRIQELEEKMKSLLKELENLKEEKTPKESGN